MTLREVTGAFEAIYDPAWAASWDAVGLVCGDPEQPVSRILFAVDPVTSVVDEALAWNADLVITHHPLLLGGVNSVAATGPKGRVVHRLIRAGTALYTAHTNADTAFPGVSDALARKVGLTGELRPLAPDPDDPAGRRGIGRVGRLPATVSLREFAHQAANGLPEVAGGVRVAGDPDRMVDSVAVAGGAGDSLMETARTAGVDAYLTSDLRHHPASEFVEHPAAPALLDTAHWASEHPWLDDAASRLVDALRGERTNVDTRISTTPTDAWSQAVRTSRDHGRFPQEES
ncbi:Nif3-like dinuclear metal center hexameric protein [Haloactinospora alba]|uniref:Nif3-like dinuclear metal center hexameric protein n=1 Tax=Haloactinospora alba TaxID=405555 RepID=UPI001153835D